MNELERGLLNHHLKDFENLPKNLTDLSKKLKTNKENGESYRAKKALDKVIAMFGPHEFWSK
jgi:hypothetical protein